MSRNDTAKSKGQPIVDDPGSWWSDSRIFAELVQKAGQKAVRQAVEEHHRAGNPVAKWRDGRVVLLYPDGSIRPVEETPEG